MTRTVAIYLVNRHFGGPEEGGWWYEAGAPADEYSRFTRTFRDKDRANAYADRLNQRLCARLNKGRRPISSVLSEGEFIALVRDGNPSRYPESRPCYE